MIRRCLAAAAATALAAALAPPAGAAGIMIRMADSVSAQSHMNVQIFGPWCERVSKESGGTVDARLFPGSSIASSHNIWDRTLSGVVDIGYVTPAYVRGRFPRTSVSSLPREGGQSLPSSIALWHMVQPGGALHDEWKEVHVLAMFAYPTSGIVSTVPIHKMEDFKGLKVAAFDRLMAQWLTRMGAAPVTLAFAEGYEALNRGTVTAIAVGFTGVQPLHLWEVAKYYTAGNLGGAGAVAIAMNRNSYAKLPDKGKAAIDRNAGLEYTKTLGAFWDRIDAEGRKLTEKHGGVVYDLPAAELTRWGEAADPLIGEWVKRTPDGAKVLAEFRKLRDRPVSN
jgi:TRAP-type transport system periplasmic protein